MIRRAVLTFLLGAAVAAGGAAAQPLAGRVVIGYQGWFGCPGDVDGNARWFHWFRGHPAPDRLLVDMLPRVDDLPEEALCDTGLRDAQDRPVRVYTSMSPAVVEHHFALLRRHGLDTVALQRFVVDLLDPVLRARADRVLRNALAAAARHHLQLYVTYDVSGAPDSQVIAAIEADWQRLGAVHGLRDHAAYVRVEGRPVVALWGFGFRDRPGDPAQVLALIGRLRGGADGTAPAIVVGGVPSQWRTLAGDARPDPRWSAVYRAYDVISPWYVGRFASSAGARDFYRQVTSGDLQDTAARGAGYLPVVFPGFSWANLMHQRGQTSPLGQIPRQCGRFLGDQIDALATLGAPALFVAMFDEVDEGTAIAPTEADPDRFPRGARLLSTDEVDCAVLADGYLRLTGAAAQRWR